MTFWKISALTYKVPPIICKHMTISNFAAFSKIFKNKAYFMKIVCWQMVLVKYTYLKKKKKKKKKKEKIYGRLALKQDIPFVFAYQPGSTCRRLYILDNCSHHHTCRQHHICTPPGHMLRRCTCSPLLQKRKHKTLLVLR